MADLLTRADMQTAAERALRAPDSPFDPEMLNVKGSVLNVLVAGVMFNIADEVQRRASAKLRSDRPSTAKGQELDAVIYERTFGQVIRLRASLSWVDVQISRPAPPNGGQAPAGTVEAGTKILAGPLEYELEAPVPFGEGQLGPITGRAVSTVAGSGSRVAPGAVSGFSAPGNLFDSTLVVTNAARSEGGADEELDDAFKARAADWSKTLSKATLAALQRDAEAVPGVAQAAVLESFDRNGEPTAPVRVAVADPQGAATSRLGDMVRQALYTTRAAGTPVRIIQTIVRWVPMVLAIDYEDGVDTVAAQALARDRVVAAMDQLGPGERFDRSLAMAVLRTVSGAVVPDDVIREPTGDIVPSANETLRTRSDLIKFV